MIADEKESLANESRAQHRVCKGEMENAERCSNFENLNEMMSVNLAGKRDKNQIPLKIIRKTVFCGIFLDVAEKYFW